MAPCATDNISNLIDSTIQRAPIYIAGTNSLLLSTNVLKKSLVKHPDLSTRRHVLRGTLSVIPGILAGTGISTQIKPTFQQKQAYHYENILVDLPEFQQFRGQYFSFEQVDN